ncbi:MAG: T9SS type A sorting domain-containing protein [Paludibacteraceae bacterium]|nr:T9SS type A sorting domain-containing protein [Paludibacteraceae bacterium]
MISGYTNSYFEYSLISNDGATSKKIKVYVEHPLSGLNSDSYSLVLDNVTSKAKAVLLESESGACRVGGGSTKVSAETRVLETFTPDYIQGPKLVCGGSVAEYSIAGLPDANNLKVVWSVSKGAGYVPVGSSVVELDDKWQFTGPVLKLSCPNVAGRRATINAHVSIAGADPASECVAADLTPLSIESREGAPLDVTSFLAGCVTSDGRLTITAVSPTSATASDPVSYNWNFTPSYLNNLVETADFNTVTLNMGVVDAPAIEALVSVENSCGVGDDPQVLRVNYMARSTTWTGAADNDWNNSSNWTNGVPGACTDVYINAPSSSVAYPIIEESDNAIVNSIHFKPNSGVIGLQYLDYNRAYVSVSLARDRYFALSSPLQEMHSADFYFYGYPNVYMKKFNCMLPGNSFVYGGWTDAFTSLVEPLPPGHGYAVKAGSKSINGDITASDMIVTLPREDADGNLVKTVYRYNPLTGKRMTTPYHLDKDNEKAYRFAFETLLNPSDENEVIIPITANNYDREEDLYLVPNPVLAHLCPLKFYNTNQEYIEANMKVWDGSSNSFVTLNAPSRIINGQPNCYISPFQSIVVKAKNRESFSLKINLNTDFNSTPGDYNQLRNSSAEAYPYRLDIVKSNGDEKSLVTVTMWPDETSESDLDLYSSKDRLFFDERESTEMYYVDGSHKGDIKAVRTNAVVPLGFNREDNTQEVGAKLRVSGAEMFPDTIDVFLVNTVTGDEINLRDESSFELPDTLYSDGDLQIEFRRSAVEVNAAGDEVVLVPEIERDFNDNGINIFADNNTIRVTSSKTEPISQVVIYDELGRVVVSKSFPNVQNASVQLNSGVGSLIVKAVTATKVKSAKVFVK